METNFASRSLAYVFKFSYTLVLGSLFTCATDISENPLGFTKPNPRSFSQLNSTRGGGKGGGAYRWRDCSGEVVKGIGEVVMVTPMCGSSQGIVGVGRSTCAGGVARRRRGLRPILGDRVQLNRSVSFTRYQGRHGREELKNGSPNSSVYAWWRVAEVRRR
jgi:hypothetical protein